MTTRTLDEIERLARGHTVACSFGRAGYGVCDCGAALRSPPEAATCAASLPDPDAYAAGFKAGEVNGYVLGRAAGFREGVEAAERVASAAYDRITVDPTTTPARLAVAIGEAIRALRAPSPAPATMEDRALVPCRCGRTGQTRAGWDAQGLWSDDEVEHREAECVSEYPSPAPTPGTDNGGDHE